MNAQHFLQAHDRDGFDVGPLWLSPEAYQVAGRVHFPQRQTFAFDGDEEPVHPSASSKEKVALAAPQAIGRFRRHTEAELVR